MATGEDLTKTFFPMTSSNITRRPIRKRSRIAKRKKYSTTHFRFGKIIYSKNIRNIYVNRFFLLGGNRKDPLNLNSLIHKKKQSILSSTANNDKANGDRPIEILLQPDIFDPLRLDTSSRNNDDINNICSIPSNSNNESQINNRKIYPVRKKHYEKQRRTTQPSRYGNFQGYYGYRHPNHDQRLQYLEYYWFHNKKVLDIGKFQYGQKNKKKKKSKQFR